MRKIRYLLLFTIIVISSIYALNQFDMSSNDDVVESDLTDGKKSDIKIKKVPDKRVLSKKFNGDLFDWIGQSKDRLEKELGTPIREDVSAYGYVWSVYTNHKERYIQFGIDNNEIKTIFATGKDLSISPVEIGQSYDEINQVLSFKNEVDYKQDDNSYQFRLNKEDMKTRPIARITNNLFIQCFFDTFTDELVAIRLITGDLLLKHRSYEIQYRGNLPDVPELTDAEWETVEQGMEQQIFDITNVFRNHFSKPTLNWDDKVSDVAFLHSKDMADHNYFSHYSLDGRGLKERLAEKEVYYVAAGENIAAQYPDAPAAMIGWLNSEGHREALLSGDYTHLGTGVYRLYYTQNFLGKP